MLCAVLQQLLHNRMLVSPTMSATSSVLSGGILIAAGAYQWTPIKNACLRHCRSPLTFLLSEGQEGTTGAFLMGAHHGLFCIGCCWMLMMLPFAAGVMNLGWMAGITVLLLLEKAAPCRGANRPVLRGSARGLGSLSHLPSRWIVKLVSVASRKPSQGAYRPERPLRQHAPFGCRCGFALERFGQTNDWLVGNHCQARQTRHDNLAPWNAVPVWAVLRNKSYKTRISWCAALFAAPGRRVTALRPRDEPRRLVVEHVNREGMQ